MANLYHAVNLRPMVFDEFEDWRDEVVFSYARQAADTLGGEPIEYLAEAERQTTAELPDGLNSVGQEIYVIEVDGEAAGSLWVATDLNHARAFIISLEVKPEFRMEGVGLRALRWAEDSVRERGVFVVGAHLFGVNRRLVDRLAREGYECREYIVEKRL